MEKTLTQRTQVRFYWRILLKGTNFASEESELSMFSVPGAYDRAITVFSPDGRLFQVEYASETVKRGATVLGIACPEGVLLAAEERATSKLQDPSFMWKIFQIDEHVGAAVAGLSCDAHILVDQARVYAQSNRLLYDEPIDVEILTRRIGEIKQLYTQHAGVRPLVSQCCLEDLTGRGVAYSGLIPAELFSHTRLGPLEPVGTRQTKSSKQSTRIT